MEQGFLFFLMKGEVKLFFLRCLKQNSAEAQVADCKDAVVRACRTPCLKCCGVVCLLVARGVEAWVAEPSHVKYNM